MNIHFFEEYPTPENLSVAALIPWRCTVFLATHNRAGYKHAKELLATANPNLEAGYWPLLGKTVWASPFADEHELLRVEQEVQTITDNVLLDLELPLKHPKYFIFGLLGWPTNRNTIKRICRHTHVVSAEYPPTWFLPQWKRRLIGMTHPQEEKRIPMFYTSMMPDVLKEHFIRALEKKKPQAVALGTIGTGQFGNEPMLTPDCLAEDLSLCHSLGVQDVYIYRLGSLTEEHIDVLRVYAEEKT